MIKPVNKHILVEIITLDQYKKSKSGLIVPNTSSTDMMGRSVEKPQFVVVAKASDVTLDVKEGDKLETWDSRVLYFYGENDEKLALLNEASVAAILTD